MWCKYGLHKYLPQAQQRLAPPFNISREKQDLLQRLNKIKFIFKSDYFLVIFLKVCCSTYFEMTVVEELI